MASTLSTHLTVNHSKKTIFDDILQNEAGKCTYAIDKQRYLVYTESIQVPISITCISLQARVNQFYS